MATDPVGPSSSGVPTVAGGASAVTPLASSPQMTSSTTPVAEPKTKSQKRRERRCPRRRARDSKGRRRRRRGESSSAGSQGPRLTSRAETPAREDRPAAREPADLYCPVCQCRIRERRLHKHIEALHLPWWLVPDHACWRCRVQEASVSRLYARHGSTCSPTMSEADAGTWAQLCNGLIRLIRNDLGCQSDAGLLTFITKRRYYPTDSSP